MATAKKKDTEASGGDTAMGGESLAHAKAPGKLRVEITLGSKRQAKVFTSRGPFVTGSVCELPADEAERYIDQGIARISPKDVDEIAPTTNVEKVA